jgi:hypothetical protein
LRGLVWFGLLPLRGFRKPNQTENHLFNTAALRAAVLPSFFRTPA